MEDRTRYLLGLLSEEEREAFEVDYFADDEAYERVLAAEDDLFDAYAAGRLGATEEARFRDRYLATAEGRSRLAFARALQKTAAPGPAAVRGRPPSRITAWVGMAASLAAVAFAGWLGLQNLRLRGEVEALRPRPLPAPSVPIATPTPSPVVERQPPADGSRVASLTLSPGLERGAGSAGRLVVPAGTAVVALRLVVEGRLRASYRASLQSPGGEELFVQGPLGPEKPAEGRPFVRAWFPADVLRPGDYVLVLLASRANGYEDVAEYTLRVDPR